jgi:hypothetical protein
MFVTSGILSSVIRSGILPYQSIFYSDHRPCFLDIDAGVLFEENTHEIVPPCRRQLQFNDPFLVEKYNELLQHQLAYQKIPEKLADLQKTVSLNGWSPADQVTYENFDHIIMEAMLYAEKKSSKKYTGRFSWSPDLIKAVQAERYWK